LLLLFNSGLVLLRFVAWLLVRRGRFRLALRRRLAAASASVRCLLLFGGTFRHVVEARCGGCIRLRAALLILFCRELHSATLSGVVSAELSFVEALPFLDALRHCALLRLLLLLSSCCSRRFASSTASVATLRCCASHARIAAACCCCCCTLCTARATASSAARSCSQLRKLQFAVRRRISCRDRCQSWSSRFHCQLAHRFYCCFVPPRCLLLGRFRFALPRRLRSSLSSSLSVDWSLLNLGATFRHVVEARCGGCIRLRAALLILFCRELHSATLIGVVSAELSFVEALLFLDALRHCALLHLLLLLLSLLLASLRLVESLGSSPRFATPSPHQPQQSVGACSTSAARSGTS
jgi:hypothetical protein